MPITLFGSNYTAPNTFAFMNNPDLQWMPMDKFVEATGTTDAEDYWAARDVFVAQRLTDIGKAKWDNEPFNFVLHRAENNLYDNRKAWWALDNIMENGGNILAFDTETIGDFVGDLNTDAAQYAGITEIGFAVEHHKGFTSKNYNRARTIENPPGSFFFGIDSKQKKWLEDVLQKKINGQKLTDAEKSAMERASRHSTLGENAFSTFEAEWKGQKFTFVKQLGESKENSIKDIQSGIEAMAARYNPNRDTQIEGLISYIDKFTKNKNNKAIVGQNLEYDVNVMNRYASTHGFKGLSDNFQYADSMFALRAWASANNTTVGELVKQINPSVTNNRLGSLEAFTEAMTSSIGYTQSLAHNAYEDSLATLQLFNHIGQSVDDTSHFNIVQRAINLLNSITNKPNSITLNNSYVKINSKGNIRSQDVVVIDGQATTGYSVSNQYWKFSGVGSTQYDGLEWNGHRIAKTSNKYLARFESINGSGATLIKAFEGEADFKAWLTNHTTLVHQTEANIDLQNAVHDRDIARRVIDGFFDAGQVSAYKKGGQTIQAGGFANFQNYYKMYQDLASLSDEAVSSMHLLDTNGKEIKTVAGMLSNISTGKNITNIIDYADKNQIDSITSHFRNSKVAQSLTARQAGVRRYDERKIMQQTFNMFDANKEFFSFANSEITKIDTNLSRTIAFSTMRDDYLKTATSTKPFIGKTYTIDDLNSVMVPNGSSYARINVEDVNKGSRQLLNTYRQKGMSESEVADKLLGVAKTLKENGLLTPDDLSVIQKTHGASNRAYSVAQSIVTHISANSAPVRKLGYQTVGDVKELLDGGFSIGEVAQAYGIYSYKTLQFIQNKDKGSILLESATSNMAFVTGKLSDEVKTKTTENINRLSSSVLIKDNFDITKVNGREVDNFSKIRDVLLSMNYDKESIGDYSNIYFTNYNGKSNIASFNKKLEKGQDAVRPLFFKSQTKDGSAFAIFTRDKDYSNVYETLSNLDSNASNKQIKEALEGKASYLEIPYLEIFNLEENDTIRKLTGGVKDADGKWSGGHGARAVLVKQGDNFYKYDTLSLNMYEKDGVIKGGIKDQGGSYLTSIRQRMQPALEAASVGDYRRSISLLNNPNIARMSDEASPQMNGTYDLYGNFDKRHSVSVRDIEYAHTIALEPGEGNLGLLDLTKKLTSDAGYKAASEKSIQAENALRGIFKAFNDEYNLIYAEDKTQIFNQSAINSVYDSEPFKHFFQRYLTSQTGGIGSDRNIIEGIINGTNTHGLHAKEISAIKALQEDSFLQILSKAAENNGIVSKDLSDTLHLLAYEAGLDAVASESFAHKMMMHVDNWNPGMMNNSGSSGIIRPTYTQRGNYRSYRLDGHFFTDTDYLQTRLGINFGDVYTTKQEIDGIRMMDTQVLKKAGEAVTEQNISRRNIIGAVQSISDAEIRANESKAIEYIKRNLGDLDEEAAIKVYRRMVNDINTYEGKAYIRPSIANQEFFVLGDPKSIRSPQIKSIFEIGTEAEQQETASILNQLIGDKLENGTVIGRKLNRNGKFTDIIYKGQTVPEFTQKNAVELMSTGKTQAIVERQLEGVKIMADEEKATGETLSYFMSSNPQKRAKEVAETLKQFGLTSSGDIKKDIRLLNKYTDLGMDAITLNDSNFRTIVINNNNIAKHLSDTAISSRWNIIAKMFKEDLQANGLDGENSQFGKIISKDLRDHLSYDKLSGALVFDNPADNGSINQLDALITQLRRSDNATAQKTVRIIDYFEKNNIALQSIQRQQMNTFQAQAFKMDQRLYQALVMQDGGDYTKGNGAVLAEYIRSHIQEGTYDKKIARIGQKNYLKNIDDTWADIVRTRRGILSPEFESRMVSGTFDAIDYINGKFDINTKNIIKVDAQDLLSRIHRGAGAEAYANFIFRVDGKDTPYIQSLARLGNNNVRLEYKSNSFYLDLSKYGEFKFNGRKMTGIVLPYQYLRTTDEDMFLGKSTQATIKFFRTLKELDVNSSENAKKISNALQDLFQAYGKELNGSDKNSLMTKALYKMNMPNSSGALAKDAVVPTLPMSPDDIANIRNLEYSLSKQLDQTHNYDSASLQKLAGAYQKRKNLLNERIAKIKNEKTDVVSLLNITSGNEKYAKYLRHYDDNGNLVGNVIESAITTSKQMFKDTEMDTGHIGWQIVKDYFDQGGHIKSYDSFSKITQKEFEFSAEEFSNIFFGPKGQEFESDLSALMRTFKNTDHREWAERTSSALYDILYAPNLKYQTEFARQQAIINTFNEEVNRYLPTLEAHSAANVAGRYGTNALASSEYQREFLSQVNSLFESIGDRYAEEVGILGLVGRYPFFNETGVLPVRIFLDRTLHGKEIRFLGPQFSILQNLDFDGDNEFIKFLGNGGLVKKNNLEHKLMKTQFNKMNLLNKNIFAKSLKDSIKDYRYGDEASFKASLLKDLDKAAYDNAENNFMMAIKDSSPEDYELLLKDDNKDIKSLLIAHSKQIKEQFAQFDEKFGRSINNPEMVKAAIQARLAKEYIGNYSKPNLEIRDAMTYMMSLATDQKELDSLKDIRRVLFTFEDGEPGGLLTLLEQKGIDTKHVHDAATLNNSSAWRIGVAQLFANANGAEKINQDKIQEAMVDLVEGARKVFFADSSQTNLELAQEITSKSFTEWNKSLKTALQAAEDTDDLQLLGKIYLSGLYDLSQHENAYAGYHSSFRTSYLPKLLSGVQDLDRDGLNKLIKGNFTLDMPVRKMLKAGMSKTDDALNVFGRALRNGDILTYAGQDGPIGLVFQGFIQNEENGPIRVNLSEFDFLTGQTGKAISQIDTKWNPVTIRQLNENIKKYKGHNLLNVTDINTPEWNLNIRNITTGNLKQVQKHIGTLTTENNLQWLFDNVDNPLFASRFDESINASTIIQGYNAHTKLGTTLSNIIGTDGIAFRRRIIDINERLQFGIENGMIEGSKDAKELIRSINKQIAANPLKNKNRITGNTAEETITAYLRDSNIKIKNNEFLVRNLDEVKASNKISSEIENLIATRKENVNKIAKDFYDSITNAETPEAEAFNTAKNLYQTEVDSTTKGIFESLSQAKNAEEEMIYRFGWDKFARNDDFILNLNNVKIEDVLDTRISNARVGYGQFTGTKILDLSGNQIHSIRTEIDDALNTLTTGSLEYKAALNTKEILSVVNRNTNATSIGLDFTNADTLRKSYKAVFNPDTLDNLSQTFTEEAASQARESAANAARKASEGIQKKTLRGGIKESIQNMSPNTSKYLKAGIGITAGAATLGLVGHALFNNSSNDDVEVPTSLERSAESQGVNIKNKNDLEYQNAPTQAQSTQRQHRKLAPPSLPKRNRTIYHDAKSGFDFKVSAQSYQKLQAESYQRIMQGSGMNNGNINITRDNSKITDNWLENKFAQLTE